MDKSTDLQLAIKAARKAGEIIFSGYTTINIVDIKENQSQVTEIDKKSEDVIIQILEEGSRYKILAEETRNELSGENTYWAVDPLDGTTNFIRRISLCAVSIALIKDNEPIIGVVFNPITNELFYAEKNIGAYLNEDKISCSHESGILFANSGYSMENKIKFSQVVNLTTNYSIRKFGTTAYELATVAKGGGDAFVAWGDEIWDHAAGVILVREAGGIVTDWKGEQWRVPSNYVLASNMNMHSRLLEITKPLV